MLAREVSSSSQSSSQGFELWYQPIYDVTDGSVLYNEVLLRWRNNAGQLYRPRDFLASFAEGQTVGWLDRVVIEKAIQTLVTHPQLSLSINLSDQVYRDSQLVEHIYAQLSCFQVHPSQLHFELTEQSIAQNFASAIALIQDLKSIGLRGYSRWLL